MDQFTVRRTSVDLRCSLPEVEFAGCDLTGAAFDDCALRLASFGPGAYRDCDLRGNDLSTVSGTANLKRVVIDEAQTIQLGIALATELGVTFGGGLEER